MRPAQEEAVGAAPPWAATKARTASFAPAAIGSPWAGSSASQSSSRRRAYASTSRARVRGGAGLISSGTKPTPPPGGERRWAAGERPREPLTVPGAAGDSLGALARRYDSTVAAIASANGLSEAATLRVGARLSIPGQYASAAETDVGGPVPMQILLGPRETLWSIAQRYDSTIAALKTANSLKGDTLYVGQQLRILPGTDIEPTKAVLAVPPAPATSDDTLMWPLIGAITSRFGYRQLRVSGSNFHTGIDIDGETGVPIRAAHAGTVMLSGWHGGYGNLVIVTNGDTEYYYGHASALKVEVGDQVAAGDVIALVGSTGNST